MRGGLNIHGPDPIVGVVAPDEKRGFIFQHLHFQREHDMKRPMKLKPLTRVEYIALAKNTDSGDLYYPKDHRAALLELRDRGYETEVDWRNVLQICYEDGLIPNAYIVREYELDLVAAYCDKNKMYSDNLIGCRYLGLNFRSYIKAEREMRRLGFEPSEAVFLALPGGKGGRRISMMSLKSKAKRR